MECHRPGVGGPHHELDLGHATIVQPCLRGPHHAPSHAAPARARVGRDVLGSATELVDAQVDGRCGPGLSAERTRSRRGADGHVPGWRVHHAQPGRGGHGAALARQGGAQRGRDGAAAQGCITGAMPDTSAGAWRRSECCPGLAISRSSRPVPSAQACGLEHRPQQAAPVPSAAAVPRRAPLAARRALHVVPSSSASPSAGTAERIASNTSSPPAAAGTSGDARRATRPDRPAGRAMARPCGRCTARPRRGGAAPPRGASRRAGPAASSASAMSAGRRPGWSWSGPVRLRKLRAPPGPHGQRPDRPKSR